MFLNLDATEIPIAVDVFPITATAIEGDLCFWNPFQMKEILKTKSNSKAKKY